MKKRFFLLFALLFLIAGGLLILLVRPVATIKAQGMNLLVVTLDTMRADRLGCYGDRLAKTSAIDGLARQGILFQNCYTPTPLTLPAHCSLFTGRWPLAHGVRNNAFYTLGQEELALAEKLKAAGYRTSALVAAYVLQAKFGLNQGFDLYDDRLGYEEKVGNFDAEISADRVYQKFLGWLSQEQSGPFFLWVHFYDPHKPYSPPPDYLKAAGGDAYRGEVAYVDHYIGRIIDDLKKRMLLDNTLFVITGDHGEAFGEHQENGHGIFCYEESMRVPLIFSNSILFRKPLQIKQRVRLVDIMPTLLEMLGSEESENSQGQSLVEIMKGREEKNPRNVYLESLYGKEENNWAPLTGLVSGSLKYISLPQAELYDLQADPLERDNLFFKKNLQARELGKDLAQFIRDHQSSRNREASSSLSPADSEKLESLGYMASFSASAQAGVDPKIGIRYQNRIIELVAALDRGDVDRVEAEAEKLITETRQLRFPYAYVLLNHVYEKKKAWDKLEANLLRAIEIFGDDPVQSLSFKGNLLEFYFVNREYLKAERLAEEILSFSPGQTRVLEILGQICEIRQNWSGALQRYIQARKIEPNNVSLSKRVLNMYLKAGDHQAAFAEIESLSMIGEDAGDTDLLFTAAMLFIEAGEGLRAEELLRRITELLPSAHGYFDYGLILSRNGKVGQAIECMEKALTFTPNDLDDERRETALKALRLWRKYPQ